MKQLNFIVPYTPFSWHQFLSDFAAVHTYITEVMPTGSCDKDLGWSQEQYYFLFGTFSGCNSFLQNMDQTREDPSESLETVDFCMKFCAYDYEVVTENMKDAVVASIDAGYPVIAKMKEAGEHGPTRVLIGYDGDTLIIPDTTNEQKPPKAAPTYDELECLYVIKGRGQLGATLLDGFRNIEKQLVATLEEGAWTTSSNAFDFWGKNSGGKNFLDLPFEELKGRFEAIKKVAWDFDHCHNFAEVFRTRIVPELRDDRMVGFCKQIDYWYDRSHDQQWQMIALHDCRDWSERRFQCLEAGMCTCVQWTMEQLAKNDREVLKAIRSMIGVLETEQLMQTESFNYYNIGKMRFIGVDAKARDRAFGNEGPIHALAKQLEPFKNQLEELQKEYGTDIRELCFVNHSSNMELGIDERDMVGYFFKENTPVPQGLNYIDIMTDTIGYGLYITQNYNQDEEKVYVETRDRILHDGNIVPYPVGYWTAAVFTNGLPHEGEFRFGYVFPATIKPKKHMETESFDLYTTGKMRFIGVDTNADREAFDEAGTIHGLMERLEPLKPQLLELQEEYGTQIKELSFLYRGFNRQTYCHDRHVLGYFFKEGTPVPEGAMYIDILTDTIGYGVYSTDNFADDEYRADEETARRIEQAGHTVPYPVGHFTAVVFTNGQPIRHGDYRFGYVTPALAGRTYEELAEEYNKK